MAKILGKQFIFVLGPTASGKTDLAIELCQRYSAPMINIDSIQMYEHVDIGAAKPSQEELKGITSYLFSWVDYPQTITASDVFDKILQIVQQEQSQRIIFCGGSGFYIQALIEGMFSIESTDPNVRERLELELKEDGAQNLYERWLKIDPEAASKSSVNDHYRIIRALEIYEEFGKTISELKETIGINKPGLRSLGNVFKFGLEFSKEELSSRITLRTERMLSGGLVEEVEALLAKGMADWAPLASVGYKETIEAIFSEKPIDPQELSALIATKTRQLAKKQRTWFNRDSEIRWIQGGLDLQEACEIIGQAIEPRGSEA